MSGQFLRPYWGVYFVFSVQEETTLSGARTAAYGIAPDLAIAVDVTATGDTPEARPMAVELGKGPAVKVQDARMIAHPRVRDLLVHAAEAAGVPYQMEVLERGTTDAAVMQIVAYSDEIVHVFRSCRPPVGAKRRQH
ncbi:MAG TPA: hypothetical protein ENI39_08290 [Anaerolineae bacterium]|nr:hypothetical protein [Anaerolineae bacterium]